jgi:uncharacterized protein (DUF362 family)
MSDKKMSRREAIRLAALASATAAGGYWSYQRLLGVEAEVFIAKATSYDKDLRDILQRGFTALGITESEIKGKRVLLKPNLVEPHAKLGHINTHPLVVGAVAELFLHLGAAAVVVAEGAGHRRDSYLVLEESGLADVLAADKLPFFDLNTGPIHKVKNEGSFTKLRELWLPDELAKADLIVSVAKMKTHHWAGATLSMKNFFGAMPSVVYGWPKNVLHFQGIPASILDIVSTIKPHFAIIDGILGMEGDGPILGEPVQSGVLVMGRSPVAVDATCCRVMGIDPKKVLYLKHANRKIGTIEELKIEQRGEKITEVRRDFALPDFIPALRDIRLG